MRRITRYFLWPTLFLLAVAVQNSPAFFIERYYSRGLYPVLRLGFGFVSRLSPWPVIYLLALGLLFFVGFRLRRWWRSGGTSRQKAGRLAGGVLSLFSALGFFFLVFWGWNYARVPVEQSLGLSLEPLGREELLCEYERVLGDLSAFRQMVLRSQGHWVSDTTALVLPAVSQAEVATALERALSANGYPVHLRVRLRELYAGTLLRISTAGVYLAWSGEGHYDGGLHSIQKPFVMAHEMAHGYGFGDEGVCNFWAWMACTSSENPVLAYSGSLAYWRYVDAALWRIDPEAAREARSHLPKGIQNDLLAIRRQMDRYPDLMPRLRDRVYEAYLHSQGVKEGMKSYDKVLLLVQAYRKNGGKAPSN